MKGGGGLRGNIPKDRKKIIVEVVLAPLGSWTEGLYLYDVVYRCKMKALVDTGATISCAPKSAIKQLIPSAPREGRKNIKTADGSERLCRVYDVDMGIKLPNKQFIPLSGIPLVEIQDEGDTMVLGMDIITQGSLKIEGMEFDLHFNQQPLPFTNPDRAT